MPESPSFESERLLLRPFSAEDLSALHSYLNHPDLCGRRYLPWGFPEDLPLTTAQVEQIIKKWGEKEDGFTVAVVTRQGGEPVGHAEADWGWDPLSPGISIVIAPTHQHQGYGSEVAHLLLTYLYQQTTAHNVSVWMPEWNQPARQFAAKFGFTETGFNRREGVRDGKYYGEVVMDLLRPEWKARQVARKGGR